MTVAGEHRRPEPPAAADAAAALGHRGLEGRPRLGLALGRRGHAGAARHNGHADLVRESVDGLTGE